MKIADFSIRKPVTISMIMIVLVLVGMVSLPLLRVDLYPNITIPVAMVTTTWPGASPSEVEQQISKPIEAAMSTISNVKEVDSTSSQGMSRVVVQFNYGVNMDQATLSMRDKLDQVRRQLPSDADAPTVMRVDPNSSAIMTVALSGNLDPVELKRLATDVVEPRLEQASGVASTQVTGGRQRQIKVELDPAKMQAYGLSLNQVQQALQSANTSADGGLVDEGNKRITLHVNGDFQSVADIGNVPIPLGGNGISNGGGTIYLKDIATIQDTYAEETSLARLNQQPSVSIDILKVPDANTVQVADNVRKQMEQLKSNLPSSVQLTVINDQSQDIKQSIQTVVNHTLLGAIFSVLVLYLFLRRVRTTLIIGVVIPISVISTFAMMYFSNQTVNTITLGGLALGLGSLVDFAVVVIESIFRYRSQGLSAVEAARQGTAEVGAAVVASALSQIGVFAPIFFTNGIASELFTPLALTVSFSHIAALFGAITLVPMLASKWMPRVEGPDEEITGSRWNPVAAFQRGMRRLNQAYGRLLHWALGHRKTVVLSTLAMFVASAGLVPLIGFELMPNIDQGKFSVSIQMDSGTKLELTNKTTAQVENILQQIPEVSTVFTKVGGMGNIYFGTASTDKANINVELKPLGERSRSTDQVVEEVRQRVANIPGARINVSTTSNTGMNSGAPIQVQISGDDPTVLQKLSDMVVQTVSSVPGTRNVQSSLDRAVPEMQINVDQQRAAQYGLTVSQIVSAVRTAYNGTVATKYRLADSSIDVVVQYPESFTRPIENLSRIMLTTAGGGQVSLADVAQIVPTVGPTQISRVNQTRTVNVTAQLFNVDQGTAQNQVAQKIATLSVPDGYSVKLGGSRNDLNDSFKSLGLAMPLSIILVYMVMASQFESLFSPFIIMFSVPLTFIGAAIGLAVTHRALSISALTGMIMLIGIVVNNAIVLVDYTNQLRKRGMERNEALLTAGPVRLRPILMTTATTVLAMLPLVIGYGEGGEAQAPMATVVAFGLVFATLITLVLIPVVYTLFDDLGKWLRQRFRRMGKGISQPSLPLSK